MALNYSGKLIPDTQVFAMSEGITTTTYNIQKKSSLAIQKNDGEKNSLYRTGRDSCSYKRRKLRRYRV